MKNVLERTQAETTQLLDGINDQISSVDRRLHDMTLGSSRCGSDSDVRSRLEATGELRNRISGLTVSKQLLGELLSDTHWERTGQTLKHIRMEDGGKLLVGHVNTQGSDAQISRDISNVSAVRGGRGIVGVAQNINVRDFFVD